MLATYKKRSGTSDRGKEYEWLQCAYYALKFATDDDVLDFEMYTNNEFFGDFDDVALRVRFNDGSLFVFLLQLKLSEKKKTLTLSALTSDSGDFSLFKYLQSYNSVVSLKNFRFILYTNRAANFKNDTELAFGEEKVRVKHQECVAKRLLDTNPTRNRSIFKFENTASNNKQFFEKFHLFVNQQNDINLKDSISKLLKSNVKCDVYNAFVDFMRSWWAGNFKLTKYDVIAKLAELVFSPMIRTLTDDKCNEKTELIKEAILKSELTPIDNEESNVTDIWREISRPRNVKETSMVALKYGLINKGINKIDELSLETKSKVCWYLNEAPLIVYLEESKKEEILATIKLLERCKQKKKLVLVGFLLHDFSNSNWKMFKDLSNISPLDLRLKISKALHCQLQGKNPISLEELGAYNSTITKFFTADYLLQIALSDCYNIGEDLEKLPSTYISRSIPKILLNYSVIDALKKSIIYLSCNKQLEVAQRRFNKRIMKITCSLSGIENFTNRCVYGTEEEFSEEVKAEKMRGPYHHFRVIDSSSLQWLTSGKRSKFEELEQYRKINTDLSVEESEIDSHFHSEVKILTSHTGGGKTTFLKRIKNESPSDRFVVKINLKEHSHFFKGTLKFEEFWDYLVDFVAKNRGYDTLAKSLLKHFDRKRIVILWDSFDELHQDSRKFFIDCVTKFRLTGMTQWISTKTSFQTALEKTFEVFALTMLPFRLDQQSYYIQERSGVQDLATMDEFFKNVNIVADSEYLGVPLQLYILTDIFNQNPESLKSILTLTDMCDEFIEGRYTHYLKKTNCEVDFLANLIENSKDYRLEQYKIAALKTHMPDLFQALNLRINPKFIEDVRRGDFLGLIIEVTEDGGVTFEHGIFGDYFSALWCSEHCHEAKAFLYQAKYRTIKFMFDLLLAEHRPVFIQILYRKFDNLVECQIDKDRAGRSPLHVLCTYGQRHPLLDTETKDDTFIVDADRADSVQVDEEELKSAVGYLRSRCDPLEKDDLFGWTCYDYADQSQALGLIEALGDGLDAILPNLHNFKDLPSVLYYSTKLNYTNLFKAITRIPYVEDSRRGNLLHVAAENDGEAFLTWLLHHRNYLRSINKTNKSRWTPIHFASFNGNLDALKFLRSKGGTFRYQEPSVLSLATTHGHQQVIDYLISCNFNPNDWYHFNYFTQTLPLAISRGYVDIVKFIVNNGADLYKIGKNEMNALHLALENEEFEIAEFLLEKGIGIDERDDTGRNSYHHAAMNNQKSVVLFLLKKKANLNAIDWMQRSPLHYAAQQGSSEIVEIFISHKVDINGSDKDGLTPLHLAVQYGQVAIVQMLIEAGAAINAPNLHKRTPMHLAALYGLPDCIEKLASAGASLEAEEVLYERRPLHFAAWNGHEDCVRVLIGKGVQIDPPCHFRYTPLHLAAEAGSYECCQLLVEAGASIVAQNANDDIPLAMIYPENYSLSMFFLERYTYPFHHTTIPETVSELVERDVDINCLDESGVTALHVQASSKKTSSLGMMEALISKGADIKSRDRDGCIPLHHALQISPQNEKKLKMLLNADLENETPRMKTKSGSTALHLVFNQEVDVRYLDISPVVQLLLDGGAEINASDNNGFTPLHYACQSGNIDVVKLLISRGAEINRLNNHKRGALHMAAISGSVLIAEHLLEKGASIDVVDIDGDTPLDDALNAEHPQLFKMLLTKSSTPYAIDATNRRGRSVLHMASKQGSLDLVQFFLERTTSVDVVDNFGNTPLDDALFNRHYEIFDLLIQHSKSFDVNKFNQHYKCYPLHVATTPKVLNLLIGKGARVDVVDVDGNTPLHLASLAFREEVMQLLLDQDAEAKTVNMRNRNGNTPLHIIMQRYCDLKEEVVKLLIKKGAKIDIEDEDGNTPFDIQFHESGQVECKEILLFGLKNYDVNKPSKLTGKTLLHLAAKYDDLELAKWSIERGASINLTDYDGDTPLHIACEYGNADMTEFLLDKFRDSVDITKTNDRGWTVLHCAIRGFETPNLQMIKLLIDLGAQVDAITIHGTTPLDQAFYKTDADLFRFLMGKASNVNVAVTDSGYTLLHMAARSGATDLAKICLEQGLKINAVDKYGKTPLHEAFKNNHLEVLEFLFDHDKDGMFINMANGSGQTLLHQAAEKGNLDMVKLLLRKGAKIDLFDGSGDNPIDLALKNEHTDVYNFLNEKLGTL